MCLNANSICLVSRSDVIPTAQQNYHDYLIVKSICEIFVRKFVFLQGKAHMRLRFSP